MLWLITDIDTEFDCMRFPGKPKYTGDLGLTEGIPNLLDCFAKHGIRATFHIQEQSSPDRSILCQYPKVYELVSEYGQEVSLHVHVKKVGYEARRNEISTAFNRLKSNGYTISAFRAGWYFSNENTIKTLEELGIAYDCSPLKSSVVGSARWYDIPDSPYHPSYRDVTKIGNAKILMMPITDVRLGIAIHKNENNELELMKRGTELLVSLSEVMKEPVILYFTTHSWKPIEADGSGFRAWEVQRRVEFFSFLAQYQMKSLTVSEAGKLWQEGDYKPYFLNLPDLLGSYRSPFNPLRHFWLVKNVLSRLYTLKYHILGEP